MQDRNETRTKINFYITRTEYRRLYDDYFRRVEAE